MFAYDAQFRKTRKVVWVGSTEIRNEETMENEIGAMDRLYDLVTELLGEGQDLREIVDVTMDAIREWRWRRNTSPSPGIGPK